jgi:hypothetical protein
MSPTAERRTALVIGNSSYAESPLANPVNNATDIANALQQMGFAVTPLLNADLRRMRDAIETFSKQLRPGVVGLFYFAGHGLQVKGENYLVPIGARIARDQDVEFETPPKRSGSMRPGLDRPRRIVLETMWGSWGSMPGMLSTGVAARIQSGACSRMAGGCMICMGMSGNGCRTGLGRMRVVQ